MILNLIKRMLTSYVTNNQTKVGITYTTNHKLNGTMKFTHSSGGSIELTAVDGVIDCLIDDQTLLAIINNQTESNVKFRVV